MLPIPGVPATTLAMAYDTARNRIVATNAETWEWDGGHWIERTQNAQLTPGLIAHDDARRRIVMYRSGGLAAGTTWEWDGEQWTQRTPPSGPAGDALGIAYDQARQRVVLVSNHQFQGRKTWEWDGVAWTQPPSPQVPSSGPFAYDTARQVVMAYTTIGEMWEWNGIAWLLRVPTGGGPIGTASGLAYDAMRAMTVLVVGTQTWEWNGVVWTRRLPAHDPPASGPMAFDLDRQRTVLWSNADIFEWDGVDWARRTALPPARAHHAAAGDGISRRITMFGGFDSQQLRVFGDTWEWDGLQWLERLPASSPPPRSRHRMVHDLARARVVLFGGHDGQTPLGDTWEWDGTTWLQRLPAASPGPISDFPMAHDAARQLTVLLSRSAAPIGTWTWDGTNWTQQFPAQQPATADGAMADDAARQLVVYHDGFHGLPAQTWEWNGTAWTQRVTATVPPDNGSTAIAYDAGRQRIVRYGDSAYSNQVSEYDGVDWTLLPGTQPPRRHPAMAYDARDQRIVVFGGEVPFPGGDWPVAETLFHGSVVTPQAAVFGSGCAGSQGVPRLLSGPPFLGASFRIDLVDAATAAPCVFGLSVASAALQLGGGCSLYLANPVVLTFAVTSAQGFATLPIAIPAVPALRSLAVFGQSAVVDAAGPFAGLAFTAGRRFVLGD
ncbi:MAG TPA: hypothetical protein VK348_02900 [Planctomycetota bacterium]|nr:hypothetical protein [Planctomycetota bacterium]